MAQIDVVGRRRGRQQQPGPIRGCAMAVIAMVAGCSGAGALAQETPEAAAEAAAEAPNSTQTAPGGLARAGVSTPDDLVFPPTATEAPGAARLEPRNENREPGVEVVIVTGRTDWRLPDLGSSLRERREAEAEAGQRIDVNMLPLHDRLEQDPDAELFDENPDLRGVGVGMLQVFKVGVGKRDRLADREEQE